MKSLLDKIEKSLAIIIAVLMAVLVIDVTWQVVSRFILSDPSSFTEEIALFLLLWIAMLGAAYAFRRGAHLGLDIVIEKLQGAKKVNAQRLADLVCLFFACAILVYGGLQLVLLNLELQQTSAALGIQIWKIYIVIPISGVLIAIFAIERMLVGAPELEHSQE